MIRNGKNQRRYHIKSFEFLFKQKIEPDSHNYRIADHAYLLKQFTLKDAAESACEQADAALINKHGNAGENNAEAKRCTENYGIHKVERRFNKKN